jgi:salicylate hydroxylase
LNSKSVIRVGLRARDPVPKWVEGRCILLGDAAHPPVPYIGQGAMMAFEDAGIAAVLLKQFCVDPKTGGCV